MRTIVTLAVGFLAIEAWAAGAEDPPPSRSSEDIAKERVKVLSRYVGKWRSEMVREYPDGKSEKVVETMTYEPLYDGTWIKGSTKIVAEAHELRMIQMIGWDDVTKKYQAYAFTDKGTSNESIGNWDEKTKTITWKTTMRIPGGDSLKFTHATTFENADEFSTAITVSYPDGRTETLRSKAKRLKTRAAKD